MLVCDGELDNGVSNRDVVLGDRVRRACLSFSANLLDGGKEG